MSSKPVFILNVVANKLAMRGENDLAARVRAAAATASKPRVAANTEVVLDSWSEFETWFLKNRSQGLEFVFEDTYGPESQEAVLVKSLLEGYDLIERQLHELYETLKQETPVVAPEEEGAEEGSEEEPVSDEEVLKEEPVADAVEGTEEAAAESLEGAESEEGAAEEEEVLEEEPTEAEQAAEEVLAPEPEPKGASTKTPEAKAIAKLEKTLKKTKIAATSITFAGHNTYRAQFATVEDRDAVLAFLQGTKMQAEVAEHPVKHFLHIIP